MDNFDNFVGVYENAFPLDYCEEVIKFYEDMHSLGMTHSRQATEKMSKLMKHDTTCFLHELTDVSLVNKGPLFEPFARHFWAEIYPRYVEQYATLESSGAHAITSYRIQKTEVGQGYHVWHYESADKQTCNRLLAWTLYLNDVEEGGETEFLYYPKRVKPKAGTFSIWPAAFTHTHRGNPPISNTKYIVTGWVEF